MNKPSYFEVKTIHPLQACGKNVGYEINGSFFQLPFSIKETSGMHNFRECEACKEWINLITNQLSIHYHGIENGKNAFPNCCSGHVNLLKNSNYNKKDFDEINVPLMAATKVILTKQHLINREDAEDWYEDICEYIDYAVTSFGSMPESCGEPLYLTHYIRYTSEIIKLTGGIDENKKTKILEHLENYNPENIDKNFKHIKEQETDFNILIDVYHRWLKIFPFEISFFTDLKQKFEDITPLVDSSFKVKNNRYSGAHVAKLHTKESLFEALLDLTDQMLKSINSYTLYKRGLLTAPQQLELELSSNERLLKLKKGYKNKSTQEEARFRKMIKEWFKDEQSWLRKAGPIIQSLSSQEPGKKTTSPKNNGKEFKQIEQTANSEESSIKDFKDIFINPDFEAPCVNILLEVDPPLIYEDGSFKGEYKAAMCVWLDVLKNHKVPIIKRCGDKDYTRLLNQRFPGLNMDSSGSMFRKLNTKAITQYNLQFKNKLSQLSQGGKIRI